MPSSLLFGVNNEGRVYTLSTAASMWRELPYNGQEFKKLSGVPHFLWGLGGDHQLYVYVHGLDIPIRTREESYENERWLPIEGFTSRLLPTDRFHFSNADGTVDRSIDKIRLPSMAWQWEGDWQLELTLDGAALDHNGWTYAVDFPAQFYAKKQWKSCVRRRLWVRTAKYCAMNSWCAIAPLHKDATKEPYIDVAVGGQNVAGAEPGTVLVWAVTSHNRVMFRVGVSTRSPEGARWCQIAVPPGCEINQVSVGPGGLVWAALLDGGALVRLGVTRDNLAGESWLEVRSPGDSLRITQLSVGGASVWAVTHDKQIWFRQGVKAEGAGVSEEMAAGTSWIAMVGRMLTVSVTSNDQVFAVGADDRLIYHRTGIGATDSTGKRWRALRAPLQVSRASSNASLGQRDKFHRSLNHLGSRPSSMIEPSNLAEYEEQSRSAPLVPTSLCADHNQFEVQAKHHKAWSPVHSVGSIVGTEAHPETDESVWSETSRDSCLFSEEDEMGWAEFDAPWSWVEAGTCLLDGAQPPNWFPDSNCGAMQEEFEQPWRNRILDELKGRQPRLDAFAQYEKAVDTAAWLHKCEARVNRGDGHFVDCILQLEWIQTAGTLTVLNPDGATSMHSFPLSDVTCVQLSSEPGSPRLTVHTPRNSPPALIFQFSGDAMLEEWQTHLYTTCGKLRDATEKINEESVWAVTNLGDVFVWDSAQLESAQLREDDCYVQKFDLSGKECPIKVALHVGCAPGTILTLTGCVADDAERLGINLEAPPTYRNKHKAYAELENVCLHLNPRLPQDLVVRNSMTEGRWDREERDGANPFVRGHEFKLTIDSTEDAFRIRVNDAAFATFRHRLSPHSACFLHLWGRMRPFKLVIRSPAIVVDPLELYWRQVGGHLRRVESCNVGVTWGIGYDHTAWVYTGGWGGGFVGAVDSQNVGAMTDSQDYRVYENQRWNPVSGYTSSGLPTDRHMWSDVTGKQKRLKEQVKLLSGRWQWVSDWMVDFHVAGGVDKEGWQYAVDFPATYHPNKQFTDMVRRRRYVKTDLTTGFPIPELVEKELHEAPVNSIQNGGNYKMASHGPKITRACVYSFSTKSGSGNPLPKWYRRCAIATTGPWHELGHTKLLAVTLEAVNDEADSPVAVWALATGGQAMFRVGTSRANPAGYVWEHVTTDQPLTSISCGPYDQVWAVGRKGCAYLRAGIKPDRLQGDRWVCVQPPGGAYLKHVSVNCAGVWAVDAAGRLNVRKEVTSSSPEGSHWQTVTADPPILNAAPTTKGFKQVSVGKSEVWTITDGGAVARRVGVCADNPAGCGWDVGIAGNWQHVSVRGFR